MSSEGTNVKPFTFSSLRTPECFASLPACFAHTRTNQGIRRVYPHCNRDESCFDGRRCERRRDERHPRSGSEHLCSGRGGRACTRDAAPSNFIAFSDCPKRQRGAEAPLLFAPPSLASALRAMQLRHHAEQLHRVVGRRIPAEFLVQRRDVHHDALGVAPRVVVGE